MLYTTDETKTRIISTRPSRSPSAAPSRLELEIPNQYSPRPPKIPTNPKPRHLDLSPALKTPVQPSSIIFPLHTRTISHPLPLDSAGQHRNTHPRTLSRSPVSESYTSIYRDIFRKYSMYLGLVDMTMSFLGPSNSEPKRTIILAYIDVVDFTYFYVDATRLEYRGLTDPPRNLSTYPIPITGDTAGRWHIPYRSE